MNIKLRYRLKHVLKSTLKGLILFFSPVLFANGPEFNCPEFTRTYCGVLPNAVQMALVANAGMSIGLLHFDEYYSYGFNLAGKTSKTNNQNTQLFTPSLFAGGRYYLGCSTYFAYGIDLASKFGKQSGQNVKNNIGVGPYISLDYHMTECLVLTAWIDPYFYNYEKIGTVQSRTHSYFNNGGVGISYFFN